MAGRGPGQRGWYEWVAREHTRDCTVLDAGCGLGYGISILRRTARTARGQDLDPRLGTQDVDIQPLETYASKSVDVIVAIDVIEHIDNDSGFLAQAVRIASRRVILTTPNWTASRCAWPYHIREYTPSQLRVLCAQFGDVRMWKGTPDGKEVHQIEHPRWNDVLNTARATGGVAVLARTLNLLLPRSAKIHSHLAACIDLTPSSVGAAAV